MACLVILRGPQCSGKTEVSKKLKEIREEIQETNYLLKLDEVNTERFENALNDALYKSYKYVVGELNCLELGTINSTRKWLQRFKDKDYQIISFVLWARKEIRLHRCKSDPKRRPFDIIDQSFFDYDSETFETLERDGVFQKELIFMK